MYVRSLSKINTCLSVYFSVVCILLKYSALLYTSSGILNIPHHFPFSAHTFQHICPQTSLNHQSTSNGRQLRMAGNLRLPHRRRSTGRHHLHRRGRLRTLGRPSNRRPNHRTQRPERAATDSRRTEISRSAVCESAAQSGGDLSR